MIEITSFNNERQSIEISLNYGSYIHMMSIDDVNRHNRIDIERPNR